jgi:ribonuclease Z
MQRTTVTFLGTAGVVPDSNNDTATLIVNDRYLFDAGWYAALNMLRYGFSPLEMDYIFISHFHQDHYLGLAQALFYMAMNKAEYLKRDALQIAGPKEDIDRVMELCFSYLQTEKSPDTWKDLRFGTIPLGPGESIDEKDFRIDTSRTIHKVPGLCYVFTDKRTGKRVAYTGDTGYHEPIAEHVREVDLLIHDASCAARSVADGGSGHSGAPDAARIACLAEVKKLALIHCRNDLVPEALEAAKKIFPNTCYPEPGEKMEI